MRTLDRYIVRSFLFTALLCFFVLMAMRVIVDLFVNMDEFAEQSKPFLELMGDVFVYYSVNSLVYFVELGGVIIVSSAAFTLAYMNHTNELVAMLASGVSLHRVVWPIIVCAILMGVVIVIDQEFIIPLDGVRHKLVRSRDDVAGTEEFQVRLVTDGSRTCWYSRMFDPVTNTMACPLLVLRDSKLRAVASVSGTQACPANSDIYEQRGWVFDEGMLAGFDLKGKTWPTFPNDRRIYTKISATEMLKGSGQGPDGVVPVKKVRFYDKDYRMWIRAARFVPAAPVEGKEPTGTLLNVRFIFQRAEGQPLVFFFADSARWEREDVGAYGCWRLTNGRLFYPTDMSAEELELRKSSRWLQYMSTRKITRLLNTGRVPDPSSALMTMHVRITEPINNLVLLLLALPFILSRQRNIKASATLCLLMVGTYYTFIYVCRYIGLDPAWAAWLPIFLFGPIAFVMLDAVKT